MTRRRWSTTVRRRVWERFGKTCQMCQQPTDERGFDLDHHIPLAIGGEDVEENLRPLCRPCHRIKTAKTDQPRITKTRHMQDRHTGAAAPKRTIQSRGFPKKERPSGPDKLAQIRALRERMHEDGR